MRFHRLTRASALLLVAVSSAAFAFQGSFPSFSVKFGGETTDIHFASGGWPTHEVIHDIGPENLPKKHIGKPKFEDIKMTFEHDWNGPMTAWLNECMSGRQQRTNFAILLQGSGGREKRTYNLFDTFPQRVVFPAFDSEEETSTLLQVSVSAGHVDGDGNGLRMKAKEKANRTKCSSNLRFGISEPGGAPKSFDVYSSEEVVTKLIPVDLDGDAQPDVVHVDVGNLVIYLPAVQAGYFMNWLEQVKTAPLEEKLKKLGLLEARIKNGPTLTAGFKGMFPISVAKMADGSVRVEFSSAEEQLKANPRH